MFAYHIVGGKTNKNNEEDTKIKRRTASKKKSRKRKRIMSINSEQHVGVQARLQSIDSLENSQSERKSLIPRQRSYDNMAPSTEANVLVIYTGGTIGMTRNSNNGKFLLLL